MSILSSRTIHVTHTIIMASCRMMAVLRLRVQSFTNLTLTVREPENCHALRIVYLLAYAMHICNIVFQNAMLIILLRDIYHDVYFVWLPTSITLFSLYLTILCKIGINVIPSVSFDNAVDKLAIQINGSYVRIIFLIRYT